MLKKRMTIQFESSNINIYSFVLAVYTVSCGFYKTVYAVIAATAVILSKQHMTFS